MSSLLFLPQNSFSEQLIILSFSLKKALLVHLAAVELDLCRVF